MIMKWRAGHDDLAQLDGALPTLTTDDREIS